MFFEKVVDVISQPVMIEMAELNRIALVGLIFLPHHLGAEVQDIELFIIML